MEYFVKNQRLYATLAAILLTAVLVFSSLFILNHMDHACIGEECSVCMEIEACADAIQLIIESIGIGAIILSTYENIYKILMFYVTGVCLCPVSLIRLKTRLDN